MQIKFTRSKNNKRRSLLNVVALTYFSMVIAMILFYSSNIRYRPEKYPPNYLRNQSTSSRSQNAADATEYLNMNGQVRNEWTFIYNNNKTEVVAMYSAYYDDRLTIQPSKEIENSFVRISGLIKLSKPIFCLLFVDKSTAPFHVEEGSIKKTGRANGYLLKDGRYIQSLISCRVPNAAVVPTSVALAFDNQTNIYFLLKVRVPPKRPDHVVAICVPISFGTVDESVFIEWMEFYRYVGVRSVHVYDAGMTNMSRVFDYYSQKRVLHVHPLGPIQDNSGIDGVKLNSAISLNDCMMRHMYDAEYVLSVDFDEFILLKKHRNFRDLVDYLEVNYKNQSNSSKRKLNSKKTIEIESNKEVEYRAVSDSPVNYSYKWEALTFYFRNIIFFPEHPGNQNATGKLYLTSFSYAYKFKDKISGTKTLVNPRKCLVIFNHYCLVALNNGEKRAVFVDEEVAGNHHIRKCNLRKTECAIAYASRLENRDALLVEDQLSQIVREEKIRVLTLH